MSSARNKTVVIVAGPTASGKTAVAIELARYFKTEIISADSRQCFKELNIGVARPSEEELQEIPHHFIASHSVLDNVNAGTFEECALKVINDLFRDHDWVIMTGGTGLYIKAFVEGMDAIPPVPNDIREDIIFNYESKGLKWLQEQVQQKDPDFFRVGEVKNPHRLMRALEVITATGKSILEFHKGKKEKRDFLTIKIGLEINREQLRMNIDNRVDKMIENGLVGEVKNLTSYKNLNALQTVGYSEIFEYLEGKISLKEAIELIKKNTRQYAKRQTTWFRKDKKIVWTKPGKEELIKAILQQHVA